MARPKALVQVSAAPDYKVKPRYDAIFGIRVLRGGNFKGLWELVRMDGDGNRVQVLTDANSRGMILTIINRYIMKIVVQS